MGKVRAVLPPADHFAADADDLFLPGGQVAGKITVVFLSIGRRHEDLDVLTDHFLRGITEQPLGGGVDRLDEAPLVDADDAIDRSFQQGVHPGFAGRQRVLYLLAGAITVR